MTDRVCPKCGKDYSGDPYWTTGLRKHLARKNPCDRPAGTKYLRCEDAPTPRTPLRCLDSVEVGAVGSPAPGTPMRLVGPWLFKQVVKDHANVCFVRPNLSKNEIWVKVHKDETVRIVTRDEFIRLFVNHVMFRLFPRDSEVFGEYSCWLYSENAVDIDTGDWDGQTYAKSEFMFGMWDALRGFLDTCPNKVPLRNMLVNFV
jgi:hypothetical protein